jgi:NADP-dependent 3-hydroxy acid dehydrogenase YdfG
MPDTIPSTWFITGASSGIGLEVACAAAERGDNVVALAREITALGTLVEAHGDRVLALAVDVRRPVEVQAAWHASSKSTTSAASARFPRRRSA